MDVVRNFLFFASKQNISSLLFFTEPITFTDTPILQVAEEKTDAFIKCKVEGSPQLTVTWYFNGQQITGRLLVHDFIKLSNLLCIIILKR